MTTWLNDFSVWNIITPAIVASFVTLFINARSEKRRAERDYVTKLFDVAREDTRKAVEAAIEYFPFSAADRTAQKTAKVWMAEQDTRHSISSLIGFCDSVCGSGKLIEPALDNFIDALTGGSFSSADAAEDLDQARKIATAGARLRAAITSARQRELQAAISADFLSRHAKKIRDFLTEELGPLSIEQAEAMKTAGSVSADQSNSGPSTS